MMDDIMEAVKTILGYVFGYYIILLVLVFGLGFPSAIVRRLFRKKRDYYPDTEDVLIGMSLGFIIFVVWALAFHSH